MPTSSQQYRSAQVVDKGACGFVINKAGENLSLVCFMAGWQSVYALDCKPGLGRLNSYTSLQVLLSV
jgi:hypothetical protein